MPKKALICGVSGQDGAYLSRLLLDYGYDVYGTSRDAQLASFDNLRRLGIHQDVRYESVTITDFRSVLQALIRIKPDEVYNFAGQSSVRLSFNQPVETLESISIGTLNLLEGIRFSALPVRLYNAGSGECFGDTGPTPADEATPLRPRSPYAVAKSAAYWQVANYREAYQLFACTGLAFNHESPLRPERFVTRKIVAAAVRISAGRQSRLELGNLDIQRDWGWAPEYVEAMWRMLQQPQAEDYIIATGDTHRLSAFVRLAFEEVGLDWREYVVQDPALFRPTDLSCGRASPVKASTQLGWVAERRMPDVVRLMVRAEQEHVPAEQSIPLFAT
jgi:GDPmannose 4,6-dehydratase